jgi:hypothetical protein
MIQHAVCGLGGVFYCYDLGFSLVIFLVAAKERFVNVMYPINELAFTRMLCNQNNTFTNYVIGCQLLVCT